MRLKYLTEAAFIATQETINVRMHWFNEVGEGIGSVRHRKYVYVNCPMFAYCPLSMHAAVDVFTRFDVFQCGGGWIIFVTR